MGHALRAASPNVGQLSHEMDEDRLKARTTQQAAKSCPQNLAVRLHSDRFGATYLPEGLNVSFVLNGAGTLRLQRGKILHSL